MEKIKKVIIEWVDSEYYYELELTGREAEAFEESEAERYAKEDAERNGTTLEEITDIRMQTEEIDEEELRREQYEAWAEFMWECRTNR